MKTIIVNVPENKENLLMKFIHELNLKSKVLTDEDFEDVVLAKWINEGMKTEDVPMETIFEVFKKNGINS